MGNVNVLETVNLLFSWLVQPFSIFTALRIHVSEEFQHGLNHIGGYHIKSRGEINIKVRVDSECISFLNARYMIFKTGFEIGIIDFRVLVSLKHFGCMGRMATISLCQHSSEHEEEAIISKQCI